MPIAEPSLWRDPSRIAMVVQAGHVVADRTATERRRATALHLKDDANDRTIERGHRAGLLASARHP